MRLDALLVLVENSRNDISALDDLRQKVNTGKILTAIGARETALARIGGYMEDCKREAAAQRLAAKGEATV